MEASAALGKAGFQMALAARNESLAEAERAALRASFEAALSDLDAQIAAGGGPFMLGAERLNRTLAPTLTLTLTLPLTLTLTLALTLTLTLALALALALILALALVLTLTVTLTVPLVSQP